MYVSMTYVDYIEENGEEGEVESWVGPTQWGYKKSLPAMVRIVTGMRIRNNLSLKTNFMTLEIWWISHVIRLNTGGEWEEIE